MPRGQHRPVIHEEETRNTILRVAQQLFMEHGYRAVSTRQIADACGLTQPALYHHFSDKQDLYVAVMQENLLQTQVALERIARRGESVQERLKRVGRYLLSNAQHDHTLMRHDIRQELSIESQRVLNAAFQAGIIHPIRSLFEEGIQQGVLRDQKHGGVNTTTATHLFMSMLSQFLTQNVQPMQHPDSTRRDIPEKEHAEEIIVQLMFHGLATADPDCS
jgi:AcrR family transcriptional regulator